MALAPALKSSFFENRSHHRQDYQHQKCEDNAAGPEEQLTERGVIKSIKHVASPIDDVS